MSDSLPATWAAAAIGDVCEPVSKHGPDRAKRNFRYVDLSSIDRATKSIRNVTTIDTATAPSRAKQVLASGDVLFSNVRVYLENIAQVPRDLDGEIGSTAFCVLRPAQNIEPRYLYHFVTSRKCVLAVDALQRGNSPPSVQDSDVRQQTLPVAPLSEQRRIVSKIDELFSRIDEGEQALKRVEKLVERYRQSVLKAAVTGELTRDWRAARKRAGAPVESGEALLARILKARRAAWETAELKKMKAKGKSPADDRWKQKYKEPASPDTTELPELPEGWCKVRVDTVGEVQLGRQRAPAHHTGKFMRPYLRVANVFEEHIDTSDVMSMNFTPNEFETYALRSNDILLNEGQSKGLVGRPAIYHDELPGACFTNTLVRFRACDAVLPEFALLVFLHYMKSGAFQDIAKITTNIAHLGAGRFAEMVFPVPPLEEQRVAVDYTRRITGEVSALATDSHNGLHRATALRQSILKAAFAGQLVPQDPHDEPASQLLERIAAERAAAPVAKRGRKARATKP